MPSSQTCRHDNTSRHFSSGVIRFFALGVALGLGLVGASAATGALDRNMIERWMAATGELQDWSREALGDARQDFRDYVLLDADLSPDFAEMERAYREVIDSHTGAGRIVARDGFDGSRQNATLSTRIVRTYLAIELAEVPSDLDQQIEAALDSAVIPARQRAEVRRQMAEAMGTLDAIQRATDSVMDKDRPAAEDMLEVLRAFICTSDRITTGRP